MIPLRAEKCSDWHHHRRPGVLHHELWAARGTANQERNAMPQVEEISDIVDSLTRKNRAYQVLYALGDKDPRTLTMGEANCLIGIVSQLHERPMTQLDRILAVNLTERMQHYIAEGK